MSFSSEFKTIKTYDSVYLSTLPNVVRELRDYIQFGDVIALDGDLGAGKTTFAAELLRQLGFLEDVTSPTYVLQHLYECREGIVEHWDLYRLSGAPPELFESIREGENLLLVEWAERDDELMRQIVHLISFEVVDLERRKIKFSTSLD